MKVKDSRGMRDIPTIQGLRHRSLPTTRAQAVAELARMEHEKARLERELNMWIENQKKTEGRLQKVEERLVLLQRILDPPAAASAKPAKVRRSPTGQADEDGAETQGWREIPLEY